MALSIGIRLRQFACAQLEHAIEELTTTQHKADVAIHETRRCIKRVRALLQLVKSELPATVYKRDNVYLRNIGRQLSGLRDAAVLPKTLAKLKQEATAQLPRHAWQALQKSVGVASHTAAAPKETLMIAVVAKLRTALARVENWPLEFEGTSPVWRGIRKSYRSGRRAMKEAQQSPAAECFHEWRKQVNHLRHQLQILQTLRLGQVKPMLRDIRSLAELLGLKNDLALLNQQIEHRLGKAQATSLPILQALIRARDRAIAEEAFARGQQLYQPKAKALLRFIKG